jgi:hypothetical protein
LDGAARISVLGLRRRGIVAELIVQTGAHLLHRKVGIEVLGAAKERPAAIADMLPNRLVVGGEVDATFPTFPDRAGISTGGISNLTSPTLGAETYSETVLASGTVRGRIGYAPGSWLFYATGGFAWTYDQQSLTQLATGANGSPFLWRLGYAAGVRTADRDQRASGTRPYPIALSGSQQPAAWRRGP